MQPDNPVISVVMSVCNGEKYLAEAIESILNQTFSNFEFIIVDDGSTDSSLSIVQAYMKKDDRIVLISRDNKGLPYSLNEAISVSKANYIARMDADDISLPERLENQMNYLTKNSSVDVLYADTLLIDKNSGLICPSWRPNNVDSVLNCLEKHNFIPHPTVVFKKSVFHSVGGYNESFRTAQDLNLWLRMKEQDCCFAYLNEIVLMYRLNPSSVRSHLSDYWLSVANSCIFNGSKKKAFKYFSNLKWRGKCIIIIKSLLPSSYYIRKYK